MNTWEAPSLNRDLTNEHVAAQYPCIEVHSTTDAMALVLLALPEGDLPVICFVNDAVREIRRIRRSALVINNLRRVADITYHTSASDSVKLRSAEDILEVL